LLGLLERSGLKVPKYVKLASELTGFAVEPRYPGLSGPVTPREHQRAVRIADGVLRWAARHIEAVRDNGRPRSSADMHSTYCSRHLAPHQVN
jgi:hypothetical protein